MLAGGQETLQAGPGRAGTGGSGGSGGEPQDAWTLLPFPRDTSRKTTRKGYVFEQLLFQNGVSRGRANQSAPAEAPTPLWAGAKRHSALTSSQDFQFTGIFHNNHHDSLERFCHDSFIFTPKERKTPLLRQLQPPATFRARFFITHDGVWQRKEEIYYVAQYIKGQI